MINKTELSLALALLSLWAVSLLFARFFELLQKKKEAKELDALNSEARVAYFLSLEKLFRQHSVNGVAKFSNFTVEVPKGSIPGAKSLSVSRVYRGEEKAVAKTLVAIITLYNENQVMTSIFEEDSFEQFQKATNIFCPIEILR